MTTVIGLILFFGGSGFILWFFNDAVWRANDLACLDIESDPMNKKDVVEDGEPKRLLADLSPRFQEESL